jgi:hypothetical protein
MSPSACPRFRRIRSIGMRIPKPGSADWSPPGNDNMQVRAFALLIAGPFTALCPNRPVVDDGSRGD